MTWNESPSLNLELVNLDKEREAERPIASCKHPGPALSISDQTGPGTRREALLAEEKKTTRHLSQVRGMRKKLSPQISICGPFPVPVRAV